MVKTCQTSTCSKTCTKTRWITSAIYGRWTYESTKHGCNIEGRSQWITSKCNIISYTERPSSIFNHSSRNTTNNNPTEGGECS